MSEKLKILFSAAECAPYAKTGGLGDVVGSLPKHLKKLGHDVRVVLPRYYAVDRSKLKKHDAPLGVPMGIIGETWCAVYEGCLPNSDVPVYFLDHEDFFGRDGIFNNESGKGFMDNDNRFIFLSRATLQLAKMLDFVPDVFHVHDWHTAAVTVYLNTIYKHDPQLWGSASVLSIHNMQYHGQFYEGAMDVLGVGWECFHYRNLERHNQVNLLKGGIYNATLLSTVSYGYAHEITTPEYGWGLEDAIKERWSDMRPVLNGVDDDEWDPEIDSYICAKYSDKDQSGKAKCKEDLQIALGLEVRPDVPIIGIVSRLVHQKGIDIIAEALPGLMYYDIQIAFLGSGEVWAHFYFGEAAIKWKGKFGCHIGFSNELAHKIEAGSDFFLMPSRFEPCGLNQMYSLRYGTLPIVRATGGLNDTVDNFDEANESGNGFKFWDLTAHNIYNTVGWAVSTYYNKPESMKKLISNAMSKRFSWDEAAKKYEAIYYEAVKRKRE